MGVFECLLSSKKNPSSHPTHPEPKPLIMKCFIAAAVAALGLAGSTYALPAPDHPAPAYKEPAYAPASYSYNWAVKDDYSGNDFGQNEERNDAVTTGAYYVHLPDGRLQKVSYTVDAYGGYQANCK